ncbi:MFS family permease [Caulobacter ginsengisoli]|uniref:MFS family permease n=1 Tax=Caulobacter ginsengisoli TaxID=400775 RepID=A0ABU0IKQ5_9CAUL|nr:MFS transporter [Caulobacter ginsengisoli]MDQ0462590.1 MFS family permease [Caulobacter ginsengisoli]
MSLQAVEYQEKSPTRWALAGLALSMLTPSLDTSIANVALPSLQQAFGVPFAAVQWIVLAYLLAITSLIVGAGRLGDLVGRRRLLLGGIGLFTAASLACGLAPGLGWLVAARALQGLGAAVMLALSMAMAGETVPKARLGAAMGLLGTMSAVGTTLGPALGGMMIAGLGWRSIFLVNLPLGLLNLWLAWKALPADRPVAGRARFDTLGAALLALTLGAYALAMTGGGWPMLGAAGVGAALFVLSQRWSRSPLLNLAMLGGSGSGLIMSALVSTVMMATLVVGPFHLSQTLGLAPALVGLVMSAGPLVAALTGAPAGRLVDRFGSGWMILVGLGGMAIGLLALANLPVGLGPAGYVAAIAVVTASYALFQAANNASVMRDVAADWRGVVSGMLSLSRNLGLITGASAMGAVFAAAGMGAAFTVAAGLIGLALLVGFSRARG